MTTKKNADRANGAALMHDHVRDCNAPKPVSKYRQKVLARSAETVMGQAFLAALGHRI